MEMYQKAYQRYKEKCERFGIKQIDITDFIKNITTEQAEMMLND